MRSMTVRAVWETASRLPQPMLRPALRMAPAVLLEGPVQVRLPDHDGHWNGAEKAGQQGDERRKREQSPVRADNRQRESQRKCCDQEIAAQEGESRAQDRGDEREDDALGQQLPHEASRTRAERATDGKLALSSDASGEDEVGDIAAPDEQDECASREKHEERSAHGPDHHVLQRHDVDAPVGVRVGERLRPPIGDRVELALRSGRRHGGLQAGDRAEISATAARPLEYGHHDVGLTEGQKLEPGRKHADHRMADFVEEDRPVQHAQDRRHTAASRGHG